MVRILSESGQKRFSGVVSVWDWRIPFNRAAVKPSFPVFNLSKHAYPGAGLSPRMTLCRRDKRATLHGPTPPEGACAAADSLESQVERFDGQQENRACSLRNKRVGVTQIAEGSSQFQQVARTGRAESDARLKALCAAQQLP